MELTLQSSKDASKTHQVTVGNLLGEGAHGKVHSVTNHDIPTGGHGVVVKQFHPNNDPQETKDEINHLYQVGQLHATGKDEHGHTWAAMHEVGGNHFHDTAAYKYASEHEDDEKLDKLKAHAMKLMGDTQLHHAVKHNLVHEWVFCSPHLVLHLTCTSSDLKWTNVKFKEGKDAHGNPTLGPPAFLDWGKVKQAPQKGANGQYTDQQKKDIVCYSLLWSSLDLHC
jgi:hypothetical protein